MFRPRKDKISIQELGSSGDVQRLQQFLKRESVHFVDELGNSLLHYVCETGSFDMLTCLLDHEANVNLKNIFGQSPFLWACLYAPSGFVSYMANQKADINIQNNDGDTPLHHAAHTGNTNILGLLLDRKADYSITNKLGQTPLDLAMEVDATACARLINEAISRNTKVERDRLANEERDRLAKRERIERERLAKEERDRRERLAKEERDRRERLAKEESDRLAKEEIIERERLDRENNERELQEIVLIDVERDVFYCDGKIVTDLRYIDRIILGRCPSSIRDGDDQVFIKYAVCGRDLDREVDALRSIESPDESLGNYAVKLLSESLPRYIVLEPFGICLREFLTKVSLSSLNHLQAVEVTRAVNWLHSKHLIHGDITPHNILVKLTQTGSYQVKLCDFDNCRHFGNPLNYSLNKIRFSRPWVCPEVFFYWQGIDRFGNSIPASQDLRATPEMDYFSLGLVLACVLDKERSPDMTLLPFSSDDKTLRDYFISESYLSRISCSAVPLCRESIRKLCSFSPNSRGHLSELISLLDSLRYSNLQQRVIHLEENAAIGDRIETALCDQTQTLASLHHKSAER